MSFAETQERQTIYELEKRIAELEADIKALEWMLSKAGYAEDQIKARTPYVEIMGS